MSKLINPFDPYVEPDLTAAEWEQLYSIVERFNDEQLQEFTEWLLDHYENK